MAEYRLRQSHTALVGGIHPETHKAISLSRPCQSIPTPEHLLFPLHFSGGGAGEALVAVGDHVDQGTPIIRTESGLVHVASRSGWVVSCDPQPLAHPRHEPSPCIHIQTDPGGQAITLPPLQMADAETIRTRAMAAGIVGMGGAGFPSHQKWAASLTTLLINGAECEPYLTADDTIMRDQADAVIQGAATLATALGIAQIVIGIEDNKPEALAALQQAISEVEARQSFEIIVVPTKYPSGGERQLIWLTLELEISSRQHPIDQGILVHNPGTLAALHFSLQGQPITDRIITVTGEGVPRPQNFRVPIGTPIRELLIHAGLVQSTPYQVTVGGPMMGFELHSVDAPVIKTTNCILVREAVRQQIEPCIRCGACAEVCPVQLQPQRLYQMLSQDALGAADHEGLSDCIACAACNVVCPSNIPLASWFQHGRHQLREVAKQATIANQARQRFQAREARLTRVAADQERRRHERRSKSGDLLAKARQLREEHNG